MNDRDDVITKDKIVDAIDDELSEFDEKNRYFERDSDFFHRFEILTYARNAIYNMPIRDYVLSLMYEQSPWILDAIYTHWEINGMDWGPADQKLNLSIELVEDWLNSIERIDLTYRLHERVEAELVQYTNTLKKQTPDEILCASMRYVIYNAINSMLEPDNSYDLQDISALLTVDEPVADIYQEWFKYKPSNINEQDIRDAIRDSMRKRRAEIESNPALSLQSPDAARYLTLYVDKYISDPPALLPPPEQAVELEA